MVKKLLLVIFISVSCFASFEEYQIGFQRGYYEIIGGYRVLRPTAPVPVMKPVTPAGMTDLEYGRRMGMAEAFRRIYQRLNSWERKNRGTR